MTHENLIAELEAIELAEYIHLEHVVVIQQAIAAIREANAELQQLRTFKSSIRMWVKAEISTIATQNGRLQIDNARLRKAIKEAPHHFDCNSTYGVGMCCTCAIGAWKRNALEGKE